MQIPKLAEICDNAPFHNDVDGGGRTRELYGERIGSYVGTIKREYYNLIRESPNLYECLREATIELCRDCGNYRNGDCLLPTCKCFVHKYRSTLAKASGESEVSA